VASSVPNPVQKDVWLTQTIIGIFAAGTGAALVPDSLHNPRRKVESAGVLSRYLHHPVAQGENKRLQLRVDTQLREDVGHVVALRA
jgi:hypothetical protein